MAFYLVIHEFDDDTREMGSEIARAQPEAVGAVLREARPGHEAVVAALEGLLSGAPPRILSIEDPQILMSRQLLLAAEQLSVQFSGYDDATKEEARYAHYGEPEKPVRYSDNATPMT